MEERTESVKMLVTEATIVAHDEDECQRREDGGRDVTERPGRSDHVTLALFC